MKLSLRIAADPSLSAREAHVKLAERQEREAVKYWHPKLIECPFDDGFTVFLSRCAQPQQTSAHARISERQEV